jgi:hypothetical protein
VTAHGPFEHDPFGMAFLLAIASGLLTMEDPQLGSLTLTLVALAVATRLVHLRSPARGGGVAREELAGISIVMLAALLYVIVPVPADSVRGPLLAGSLFPLWWAARHRARGRGAPA